MKRIYNGAAFCNSCSQCPVVDYDEAGGTVRLSDPAEPERGAFTMKVEEYNVLLANAKPIV